MLPGGGCALSVLGPSLPLGGGDTPAGGGTQHAFRTCGLRFDSRRRQWKALPFELSLNLADLIVDLIFLDLISHQGHLERC
ncbi:MAG: hypothetical protein LAQ30_06890 [Acidobacteriia bacterium]|nr:hypothetical protein [Terriglobia bacterium]